MATKQDFESLSVSELKEKLEKIWHKHEKLCRTQMAPLLYHLRLKLKAQGENRRGVRCLVRGHVGYFAPYR
jgi:hypothetical protein